MDKFIQRNSTGLISACLAGILLSLLLKWWPAYDKVQVITIGANTKSSDSYQAVQAIARVVNSSSSSIRIVTLETSGTAENAALLEAGLIDMATMQGDFEAAKNIRLVSQLYTDVFQFIKQKDLVIDDISQLVNKRIAISSDKDGEYHSFKRIITHFNLNLSDFKLMTGTWESNSWAFKEKEVDVLFKVRFPTNKSLKELIKATGAELMPIKQASAICLQYPIYKKAEIPRGSYSGSPALPANEIESIGVDELLVARSAVSNEVVTELCETIFEKKRELIQHFDALGFSAPPDEFSFIPLHDGTKNYLSKKEPSFLQANSELIALGLSILAILVSAIIQLVNQQKKRRVLNHNKNLIQLKFKIERSNTLEQLEIYKDELSGFVARVVEDAVSGKISSSGFEFFSFTWESVQVILQEKEKKLESKSR